MGAAAGEAFVGLTANTECSACKTPLGIYAVQRRHRVATDDWVWQSMRLPNAEDLELRQTYDLEWGNDADDWTVGNLYIGTVGGGLWEGQLTW